jgi:hypothetical protein
MKKAAKWGYIEVIQNLQTFKCASIMERKIPRANTLTASVENLSSRGVVMGHAQSMLGISESRIVKQEMEFGLAVEQKKKVQKVANKRVNITMLNSLTKRLRNTSLINH